MKKFIYKDKKIVYDVNGEGDDILVMLNGIMMNHMSWTPFMDNLTKFRKVVTLDMFDQGFSDKMEEGYTIEDQAKLVIALLDELNIEKFDLFGISYGGHVSLNVATLVPNRVKKLTVFNCLTHTNKLLHDIGISWIEAAKTRDPELFYYITIPVIYSSNFYSKNYDWLSKRKEVLKPVFNDVFLESMIRLVNSSQEFDLRDQLHKVTAKTLVVGARNDLLTPAHNTAEIADLVSDSMYMEMLECGHASMYEKPSEFLTILIGFLTHEEVVVN